MITLWTKGSDIIGLNGGLRRNKNQIEPLFVHHERSTFAFLLSESGFTHPENPLILIQTKGLLVSIRPLCGLLDELITDCRVFAAGKRIETIAWLRSDTYLRQNQYKIGEGIVTTSGF